MLGPRIAGEGELYVIKWISCQEKLKFFLIIYSYSGESETPLLASEQ